MSKSKPRGKQLDEQMLHWSALEKHLQRKQQQYDKRNQRDTSD